MPGSIFDLVGERPFECDMLIVTGYNHRTIGSYLGIRVLIERNINHPWISTRSDHEVVFDCVSRAVIMHIDSAIGSFVSHFCELRDPDWPLLAVAADEVIRSTTNF